MRQVKAKIEPQKETMPISKFSKYDFVKSYISNAKTEKQKQEKEQEASLIADAIRQNIDKQYGELATKSELFEVRNMLRAELFEVRDELRNEIKLVRKDMEILEKNLTIKITFIVGALLGLFQALEKFY